MRKFHQLILTAFAFLLFWPHANAETVDKSRIPPVETYQAMLDANKQTGWVQFRNYDGRQLIYFSALQVLHCRVKEIRYSINSEDLNERFELVKCNPQTPFSMPDDVKLDNIAISLPLKTAKTIAVQVVWEDGRVSETAIYEPCKDVGEQTCAWPL